MAELPAARRGIPLDLGPLLSPYKGKGRLTLRVERMPGAARLSAGRNNGDATWSLNLDELEDLEYLIPEGSTNAHTLALRILAHDDHGASTLVVLDLPISHAANGAAPADHRRGAPKVAVSAGDNMQVHRLREELAKAAAALTARETELAEIRRRMERMEAELVQKDNALANARAARAGDTDARLEAIAAEAAAELEHARDAWRKEQNARIAELQARAETRMDEAREAWRSEMQDALSKAESSWNRDEADRFAVAEKQWQARANKALAEARAGADALRNESENELQRLRDDLARTRTIAAERDTELTQMKSKHEAALRRERQERDAALLKAEANWRTTEVDRFAAAEKRWQDDTAGHLAEAKARYETAELALADLRRKAREQGGANIETLRNELAMARANLDNRDAELARLRAAFENDRGDAFEGGRDERRGPARSGRSLMRDVVIVMGVVMALGLFYSRIVTLLPYGWQAALPTFAMQDSIPAGVPAAPEKPVPAPEPSKERDTAVIIRDVNLRADPSTAADIVATLPRGVDIEIIEQRGKWTRVQARGKDDAPQIQQGWIYNSYMKVNDARSEKSSVADHDQGQSP